MRCCCGCQRAGCLGFGIWDAIDWIVVTHGCDQLTSRDIRDGLIDLAIGHFPERYGENIIPAVCAVIQGQSAPPFLYAENAVITRNNVDQYYPPDE